MNESSTGVRQLLLPRDGLSAELRGSQYLSQVVKRMFALMKSKYYKGLGD